MTEEIKARVKLIKKGKLPEGYARKRELIYPQDWGNPVRLNTVLWESKERNKAGVYSKDDVLSVSGQYGVVNQIGLLGRSYAGVSIANYHVVETGDIIYTKSPLKQNPYGIIKLNKGRSGIVSTLYAVYHCNHIITGTYLDFFFSLNTSLNNYLIPLVKKGAKNDMKVNNGDVLKGLISLPPPQEQQKIVEILSTCDRLLSLQRRKIEDLKTLKKSCLCKMFPKQGSSVPEIRFPGFTDTWKICKVGELTNVLSARRVHKEEWAIQGVPFFRSSDVVSAYRGTTNEKVYISFELYEELAKSSGKLEKDDILITGGGSIGIPYIVPDNKPLYSKDADLIWIKKSALFNSQYLFAYLENREFRAYIKSISHIGTIAHYTIEQVKATPISLPTTEEQYHIGEYFTHLDNLITLHQRELEEMENYKKAMMQLLFTGIVRVN